ncbi:hypothetical protein JOC86_001882 [Bacillus pakistanensis]|uniref:Uncharacterized protein n=1 Tax=Rossellomorea pakistanensis TaxID=992288 RepID=A0ABS2NBZ1_9BACI|nr:hypothetical protein [Bacillus pakistanensis]
MNFKELQNELESYLEKDCLNTIILTTKNP